MIAATPTIDTNSEISAPKFREERSQIIGGRLPINLLKKPTRPATTRMNYQLTAGSGRTRARYSNMNPAQAGIGKSSSIWSGGMGEEGVSQPATQWAGLVVLGIALGGLAWAIRRGM